VISFIDSKYQTIKIIDQFNLRFFQLSVESLTDHAVNCIKLLTIMLILNGWLY